MSHFLLNLARRGAGLMPVAEARVRTAAEGPAAVDVDGTVGHARDAAPRASIADVNRRSAPAPAAPLPAASTIVVLASAPLSAPVIQRTPTPASPPGVAAIPPSRPVAPARPPSPTRVIEAARAVDQANAPIAQIISASPLVSASVEAVRVEARAENVRPERPSAIVAPVPSTVAAAPAGSLIEPLSSATVATTPRIDQAPSVVERTIQVRIGTIEIHGHDVPPVVAPPPAAPVPVTRPDSGFEDFAPLRSYAAWAW